MGDPTQPATSAPPPAPPSLTLCWLVVLLFGGAIACLFWLSWIREPEAMMEDQRTVYTWVAFLLNALGHGLWITLDIKRRGREVGWWRFWAIFVGPVVVWIYLGLAYRQRAVFLIPLAILIYVFIYLAPGVVAMHLIPEGAAGEP